jgi:hypothetical protein
MNIVKRIDQYNKNNIFFCEPIKNNVMNEGNFIRIIYSTHNIILNGIYLLVTLNDITCDKYYTKYKCNFSVPNHREIIENIKIIEEDLLKKSEIFAKVPQYKIYEQLKNGNLKIFSDVGNKSICSFILKISGIWETQNSYGLTYKFIKIN